MQTTRSLSQTRPLPGDPSAASRKRRRKDSPSTVQTLPPPHEPGELTRRIATSLHEERRAWLRERVGPVAGIVEAYAGRVSWVRSAASRLTAPLSLAARESICNMGAELSRGGVGPGHWIVMDRNDAAVTVPCYGIGWAAPAGGLEFTMLLEAALPDTIKFERERCERLPDGAMLYRQRGDCRQFIPCGNFTDPFPLESATELQAHIDQLIFVWVGEGVRRPNWVAVTLHDYLLTDDVFEKDGSTLSGCAVVLRVSSHFHPTACSRLSLHPAAWRFECQPLGEIQGEAGHYTWQLRVKEAKMGQFLFADPRPAGPWRSTLPKLRNAEPDDLVSIDGVLANLYETSDVTGHVNVFRRDSMPHRVLARLCEEGRLERLCKDGEIGHVYSVACQSAESVG